MKLTQYLMIVACSVAFTTGAHASTTLDDFNRPDAGTLGSNWTQQSGSSSITNNQATGSYTALATFNGASGNEVSFNLTNVGSDTQYIAAVLGYGKGDNLFVKVQNNGSASGFDSYAFYTGNNGSGSFSSLSKSFMSAFVDVKYVGTLATLTITPDAGAVQTYSFDYGTIGKAAPTGTGIGLGFYGAALADNFGNGAGATGAVPEPATWAMMLAGFGMIGFAARRRPLVKTAASFA